MGTSQTPSEGTWVYVPGGQQRQGCLWRGLWRFNCCMIVVLGIVLWGLLVAAMFVPRIREAFDMLVLYLYPAGECHAELVGKPLSFSYYGPFADRVCRDLMSKQLGTYTIVDRPYPAPIVCDISNGPVRFVVRTSAGKKEDWASVCADMAIAASSILRR